MRIVHVTDCFLPLMGGIETQVSELAARQAQQGHEVLVLTCTAGDPDQDREFPYSILRSVWPNPLKAPVDPRAPRRFAEVIDAWRPGVVHLHLGEVTPGVQGLLWKLRFGSVPMVVTVHSVWSRALTQPAYSALGRLARPSPVAWTGVSQLVASRIGRTVGTENVRVLPNGVEADFWRGKPQEHDGLVVVTAARFAPRKRIPALLRILAEVVDALPPGAVRAVLAGEGPGFDKARRFVADQQLAESVVLPGRLTAKQLRDLYQQADVFVSPSIDEAASIAAAEAQASGLAILTRSQSGLGERITPAEGASVATDEEIASSLLQWSVDPAGLRAIKEHNLAKLCPLDWSVVLPQVADTYEWAQRRHRAFDAS